MILPHPRFLKTLGLKAMPFADAASDALPLAQLLRLSLFQVSAGMTTVMLLGTLNRVMIVELSLPALLVAAMIALPVLIAPLRAVLGFRSDTYRSAIGWKRIPFLWFGTLWQMGGLAVMPFALLVLGGDPVHEIPFAGEILAAIAFLMAGLGLHMTQTAGLALAADRATEETRPRVVALLYVMLLVGMGLSAVILGLLLTDFTPLKLVRVVQGAALASAVLNLVALWKQEHVRPVPAQDRAAPKPRFADAWKAMTANGRIKRLLAVVFLGTMAFSMQDVLLEPYGGEVLGLSVSATTLLTALWAIGALAGFAQAAQRLGQGASPYLLAATGSLAGIGAFTMVIFAAPMASPTLFYLGAICIGYGGGLFAVAMLTAVMAVPETGPSGRGLVLGAWGAANATAAGLAIAIGGGVRDLVNTQALSGSWGEPLSTAATGYSVVYHIEIGLLFVTLAALGPLFRRNRQQAVAKEKQPGIGFSDFPA